MTDKVGMPPGGLAWLADPQQREYADFMAGNPAPDPDRTCGCGRPAKWDLGPAWRGAEQGRMVRCDWCVGHGPRTPLA